MRSRVISALGACLLLLACGRAPSLDAGPADAALPDGGASSDADSSSDAGPDAGPESIGRLGGACGELDDVVLLGAGPFLFESSIDFEEGFDEASDTDQLTEGGQEVLRDGNAGGSSVLSEIFAFEVLARCEGATLLKSETEVVYDDPMSKKTDLLVLIDGHIVGVSVTRAVGFPQDDPYTPDQARALLEDKLADVLASSAHVSAADRWVKQVLFVVAYGPMHAASIRAAWETIDDAIRADTILWVAVTNGDDVFLY